MLTRLKLVADWHRCHKWLSMRFIALGGVIQTAVLTAHSTGLDQYLQPWLLTTMSDVALLCIVAAGIGRIIDQPDNRGATHGPDQSV